jgi:cytoskeletal protein CcmA (bactofilin family)
MSVQSVKKTLVIAVSVLFVLLSSSDLFAFILRKDGSVGVGPSEVIEEDIYLFGDEITVEGKVNGNLFCAGKVVKVLGNVKGSAWLVGNQVLVSGEVSDGVKAASKSVTLEGRVGGDLMAAGGEVLLQKGSTVKRDLVVAGRRVSLAGTADGDVRGAGQTIDIGGVIRGSAKLLVQDLTLSTAAKIEGDLLYISEGEAKIESGAVVGGKITRSPPEYKERLKKILPFAFLFGVVGKAFGFFGALVAGLVLVLVFPKWMNGTADALQWEIGPCAGWGALTLFLTPLGAAVAAATIVGAPLAALSFLLYLIAVYASQIVVGFFIGRAILNLDEATAGKGALFGAFALGLVLLKLVRLIPIAGYVSLLAVAIFGLGAMVVAARAGKAVQG